MNETEAFHNELDSSSHSSHRFVESPTMRMRFKRKLPCGFQILVHIDSTPLKSAGGLRGGATTDGNWWLCEVSSPREACKTKAVYQLLYGCQMFGLVVPHKFSGLQRSRLIDPEYEVGGIERTGKEFDLIMASGLSWYGIRFMILWIRWSLVSHERQPSSSRSRRRP